MNNKKILIALIALIVLIVVLGTYILIGNKNNNLAINQQITKPVNEKRNSQIANVILTNAEFIPKDITIKAGSTVMWINKSGATAAINSDVHPTHLLYPFLNLKEFASGTTTQVVFEKAGKYSYHNELNLSQTGTVTVE